MNNKDFTRIAKKITALTVEKLRKLQENYDQETGYFDEVVSSFEDMKDSIADDESLEENRGFWQKLTTDYDPDQITETITTYIAGGKFIRVLKTTHQIIEATENLDELLEKFENSYDLSQLTKKELTALAKQTRNEKKIISRIKKIVEKIFGLIDEMLAKANNLKGSKKLKDIAKNETVKGCVDDIIATLEDAKQELENKKIGIGPDGVEINVQQIGGQLQDGLDKIAKHIKEGNYKQEESNSSGASGASGNIEKKLEELEGDTRMDKTTISDQLTNLKDTKLEEKIRSQVKSYLIAVTPNLASKTGKPEDNPTPTPTPTDPLGIKQLIDGYVDGSEPKSLKTLALQKINELIGDLNNGKYKDFYTKLMNYQKNSASLFIGAAMDELKEKINDGLTNDKKVQRDDLNKGYKSFNDTIQEDFKKIRIDFQNLVQNYDKNALRVTRTSSLNKIARRVADCYK